MIEVYNFLSLIKLGTLIEVYHWPSIIEVYNFISIIDTDGSLSLSIIFYH